MPIQWLASSFTCICALKRDSCNGYCLARFYLVEYNAIKISWTDKNNYYLNFEVKCWLITIQWGLNVTSWNGLDPERL